MSSNSGILLESGTNEVEIVEFFIENQSFGVNVIKVKEVIRFIQPTKIPESHSAIMGTIKHRDHIILLIDLAAYLNYEKKVPDEKSKIIIMEFNQKTYAFRVDDVSRILRLSWEQIEPPPKLFGTKDNGIIVGVVKFDDKTILLLDFEKIVVDITGEGLVEVGSEEKSETKSSKENIKIMIAEDSSMLRKMIISNLKKGGYTNVEAYENGALLWKKLEKIKRECEEKNRPLSDFVDFIITDIEMPQMDGLHLCKRIKEDDFLKSLPVAFFSSLITKDLEHKCKSVGGDFAVSKPNVKNLIKEIDRYFNIGE